MRGQSSWPRALGVVLLLVLQPAIARSDEAPLVIDQVLALSGSSFHPTASDGEYVRDTSGCIYRTGVGTPFLGYNVSLPDRAFITEVHAEFRDDNAVLNALVELLEDDGVNPPKPLAQLDSDGIKGYGSDSVSIGHRVDAQTSTLRLQMITIADGSDLLLCAVRIYYSSNSMIFADGFESGDLSAWSTATGLVP